MKQQEIRANFNGGTITVYQAYHKSIALSAIKNKRFEKPFSFQRMTWVKPSFLWMMERSGWATKKNQEFILGIKLNRSCWDRALSMGVLTHPDKNIYSNGTEWDEKFKQAKIHIQWDPERTLKGSKLNERTIQVGISRFLIEEFNQEWIRSIEDVTPLVKKIYQLKIKGKYKEAKRLLPVEKVYMLDDCVGRNVGVK